MSVATYEWIDVQRPKVEKNEDIDEIPMFTQLFRLNARLVDAWQEVVDRADGLPNTVVSIGCSNGAELDSTLAIVNRDTPGVKVRAIGLDINQKAQRIARAGRHYIPRFLYCDSELETIDQKLQAWGFATDFDTVLQAHETPGQDDYSQKGYYAIDANPVRAGHKVDFIQYDAREKIALDAEADLVLADNVLYHLTPDDATRLACNAARLLGDHGVLSIGDVEKSRDLEKIMGIGRPHRQRTQYMSYARWLANTAMVLEREFDLRPIATGMMGQVVSFSRV